jgi:hypothetical protein
MGWDIKVTSREAYKPIITAAGKGGKGNQELKCPGSTGSEWADSCR